MVRYTLLKRGLVVSCAANVIIYNCRYCTYICDMRSSNFEQRRILALSIL